MSVFLQFSKCKYKKGGEPYVNIQELLKKLLCKKMLNDWPDHLTLNLYFMRQYGEVIRLLCIEKLEL